MSERKTPSKISNSSFLFLPNAFTLAGMFCGFFGVINAYQGQFEPAIICVLVAIIFDGLDGRIARMTGTQSEFGAQLDSLADIVSFGLAPAFIAFSLSLQSFGKIGWICAFVYLACAALRLARFNTQIATIEPNFFQGLPSPAAAGLLVSGLWLSLEINLSLFSYLIAVALPIIGILMISNFRFNAFKQLANQQQATFIQLFVLVITFSLVVIRPAEVLFAIFLLYALSGPLLTLKEQKSIKLETLVGDHLDAEFPPEQDKAQRNKQK